ncbi:MAG: dienelactone hydrolase family protein [Novosphingobium sp.]|nr:dienelactone hydrolase family protein [Novosphingobium sp.]
MEQIDYHHGEVPLTGWLARPSGLPRAAVVLYPTIVNVNEPMERRAKMLADAGFIVLIADFYGKPVADFAASQALAANLRSDPAYYRERIAAALSALRDVPAAHGLPMFAVGYCMGGGAALEAARDGQYLVAAISFHGLLATPLPAQPGAVKARLLVLHGDADPMVPREQVIAFMEEMDQAGANWHLHAYSGVRHGFTDPGSDERDLDAVAYDASADRQSWAAMMSFLDEVLEA